MKSLQLGGNSDHPETGDRAGWIGLHLIVGALLGFRGIEVGAAALEQAAESTYPLVEGRVPRVLNIIGVYGGVLSSVVGDDDASGRDSDLEFRSESIGLSPLSDSGHSSGTEREEGDDRSDAARVDNPRNKRKRDRSRSKHDGDLNGLEE